MTLAQLIPKTKSRRDRPTLTRKFRLHFYGVLYSHMESLPPSLSQGYPQHNSRRYVHLAEARQCGANLLS